MGHQSAPLTALCPRSLPSATASPSWPSAPVVPLPWRSSQPPPLSDLLCSSHQVRPSAGCRLIFCALGAAVRFISLVVYRGSTAAVIFPAIIFSNILAVRSEVTDYELIPGGRNIRVTEETKHEYVDLVAEHILTTAIRPQINSFLEGFNELVPKELISIFNDKELELLLSGLPEIDLNDLQANTEYTGYSAASTVPLEGFKALQGISGPQQFQIHKAYGALERLPFAHTCFNQLDLPEYSSREQLEERLLLAIHEASEGFGFG
ncbi:hypothetical protein ZIOFF_070821 [Zingiber officinale]|uniref:HECT-type E3 ubiquitin transferase n=1 Tax=Zingiber officinale TaxID=94328 RepID=A0A8J5C331_ZINOF|nr:hypothetical protein ZIOFF_070821 [Zingiber officinale]